MVCLNIHPPAAGDTVTLSHREVRTLFHEFGHLLHLMFTRVSIPSLAGTSVPRDFVEVPSQFMENWCWRPDVLKSFARHERTGLPIPEEMLNSLDASRGNTPALALAGQLLYAKMDLAVHSEPERFSAGSLDDVDSAVAGDMDYFKDFKRAGKLRTARHLFWTKIFLKPLNRPEARTGKRQENSGKPFWKKAMLSRPCGSSWISWEESRAWTPCSAKGGWHPEIKDSQTAAASSARYRRKSHIIHLFN